MPFSSAQVSWRTHVGTWTRFFLGMRLGPYHEMSPPIVSALLKLGRVERADHLYDIGCGDGRVLITAAQSTGCRATGIEVDARVAELCRRNVAAQKLEGQISVREGDARRMDISDATVVTLYLSERGNKALQPLLTPKLLADPSTRVLSFLFEMPGWTPVQMELEHASQIPLYLFDGSSLPPNIRKEYEQRKEQRLQQEEQQKQQQQDDKGKAEAA